MPNDTTKPEAPLSAPPKTRKQFTGGIQPGTFRGSSLQYSGPPPIDPDDALVAQVKAMDASAMRHFLKQGTNRADFEAALERKGIKR